MHNISAVYFFFEAYQSKIYQFVFCHEILDCSKMHLHTFSNYLNGRIFCYKVVCSHVSHLIECAITCFCLQRTVPGSPWFCFCQTFLDHRFQMLFSRAIIVWYLVSAMTFRLTNRSEDRFFTMQWIKFPNWKLRHLLACRITQLHNYVQLLKL